MQTIISVGTLLKVLILLHGAIGLPFASPFANAGTNLVTHTHAHTATNPQQKQTQQPTSINSGIVSGTGTTAQKERRPTHLARLKATALSSVQSSSTYDAKQGGEYGSSAISRLLFNYANPIIQKASARRVEASDAFPVPPQRKMAKSVTSLARIYEHLQNKRRKQQTRQHKTSTFDKLTGSQTLLLARALVLHQRRTLLTTGLLRLLNTTIQAFPALLVARLLRLVEAGSAQPASKALWAAVHLVAVLSVKMVVENQYFHNVVKCSTAVRGSLAGLVFDKSLRLQGGGSGVQHLSDGDGGSTKNNEKNKTPKTIGAGGVLNLMQSDTSMIESAAVQVHTLWDGPLQIAIYTTLLFRYLGPSVLWGMGVLLMTIPLNSVTLRILNRLSKFENEAKDARTKRTAESIGNMKLLKLQGWEQRFADDIRGHRREELRRHVSRGMVRALNSAISNAIPSIVLVVTLTAYVKTGRPIVASTIFTAISLFNQLRFPLFFYPMLIDSLATASNAMRRIATFLSAEEIVPYVQELPLLSTSTTERGGSIELKHGNFLWSSTAAAAAADTSSSSSSNSGNNTTTTTTTMTASPALANVELQVQPSEVVAVIGAVGTGKSALVKALLGELNPVPGTIVQELLSNNSGDEDVGGDNASAVFDKPTVTRRGAVAYCSQEAWLPKGTIREAITFGRKYDEKRYRDAIYDAGLDEDIVEDLNGMNAKKAASSGILSHETDVGEGGSSLSGGQRARVALARALYSDEDTKVFLLDDVLSALDSRVGAIVFERLTRRLRNTKAATILVTNDPSIPRRCDRVVLMAKVPGSPSCSSILDEGTYDELLARGHDLKSISTVEQSEENSDSEDGNGGEPRIEVTVEGSEDASDAMVVDPPRLMTIGKHETIRLVGGHNAPTSSNGTDSNDWCYGHADCENQVTMENCPDYLGDQAITRRRSGNDYLEEEEEDDSDDIGLFDGSNQTSSASSSMWTSQEAAAVAVAADETAQQVPELRTPEDTKKVSSADDSMSVGAVPRSTYVAYFKSVGAPLLVLAMLSSYLLSNGAQFFQQYTIAKWTEVGSSAIGSAVGQKYLRSLVSAAGVVSVFLWVRSFLTMKVGVRASEFLHSRMLASVFSAPMSFFDATPSGQLLSRFGKEMQTVDSGVPDSIGSVLFCFLQIAFSVGALAAIVTSGMVLPLGVVGVLYVKMMGRFRPAARDMKRAETKTRSPIYTHFGEAIRGVETIRAMRARKSWLAKHEQLQDRNLGVFYTVKALDRWLSTRLETLGNTVVFAAAVASVFLTRAGQLTAGSAGWGLTQSLAITGLLTWAVRCLTDLESNMMSVMRVKELTDLDSDEVSLGKSKDTARKRTKMPKELDNPGAALRPLLPPASAGVSPAPLDSSALVQSGWPWRGNIQFNNVSMRYSPAAPLVLKGVSLTVPAGSTLGVVGRTGSGKSSLLLTLFRLSEIEAGGSIEIDGVDIRSVSMESLRQSLAIIPQDPVLFTGTIAYNLDATGKSSPEDMLQALEAASPQLAEYFRNADGLNTHISEGGKNLSLGQRQLICLARALVRKSKILVLDEATSSVDPKTDQTVQETIRREFVERGVSVITVAHRLDTVLGYDRIAVLGDGEMLEYGPPSELLANQRGELRQLVDADRRNKQKGAKMETPRDKESPLVSA